MKWWILLLCLVNSYSNLSRYTSQTSGSQKLSMVLFSDDIIAKKSLNSKLFFAMVPPPGGFMSIEDEKDDSLEQHTVNTTPGCNLHVLARSLPNGSVEKTSTITCTTVTIKKRSGKIIQKPTFDSKQDKGDRIMMEEFMSKIEKDSS